MTSDLRIYQNEDMDSARWEAFRLRPNDIIISAPPKSGTTWTQLLVALLVFDGPNLPAALGYLSPWMDVPVRPVEQLYSILAEQSHRRFIKTHTPLDGLPYASGLRYVCVGRDPRDAVVSMIHHQENLDRDRLREINGFAPPEPNQCSNQQLFDQFLTSSEEPGWNMAFLAHHYSTFWERRHTPEVGLFHFSNYLADLPGELLRLAEHLNISLSALRAKELASHASLAASRENAKRIAPDAHLEIWKNPASFFRAGSVGEGLREMTEEQRQNYDRKIAQLVSNDLAKWIHTGATS